MLSELKKTYKFKHSQTTTPDDGYFKLFTTRPHCTVSLLNQSTKLRAIVEWIYIFSTYTVLKTHIMYFPRAFKFIPISSSPAAGSEECVTMLVFGLACRLVELWYKSLYPPLTGRSMHANRLQRQHDVMNFPEERKNLDKMSAYRIEFNPPSFCVYLWIFFLFSCALFKVFK